MSEPPPAPRRLVRWVWLVAGLALVGVGSVGAVVPGLPTTVFFIGAAGCFARSSPRLEQWVLHLPHIGPLVRDYRAGLGMPRLAKITAVTMIVAAVTLSLFAIPSAVGQLVTVAAALVGIGYILFRVPTRERVLAEREGLDD